MLLVIDKEGRDGNLFVRIFRQFGVLAVAKKPHDAFSEINTRYRAVLLIAPERFADLPDYMKRLRTYACTVPIFALTDQTDGEAAASLFDGVATPDGNTADLLRQIRLFQKERQLPLLGDYRVWGFEICEGQESTFLGHPIVLTKTEKMILRYLMRTYPIPVSAKEILRYAYSSDTETEEGAIRTHISHINQKCAEVRDFAYILSVPGKGYRILGADYFTDSPCGSEN